MAHDPPEADPASKRDGWGFRRAFSVTVGVYVLVMAAIIGIRALFG